VTPIPTRRWLVGAAGLAAVAPLALVWPWAAGLLPALDLAWVAALLADWMGTPSPRTLGVAREAPAAFGVGRAAVVRYRWRHPARRRLTLEVREQLPDPLGGAVTPTRRLEVPPGDGLDERLELVPVRRGAGTGGALSVRALGGLGLAWRQDTIRLPWSATVYPTVPDTPLRALPLQVARRREAGLRAIRRPGEG
jgi:uncharacterized protein (DUF58 family)